MAKKSEFDGLYQCVREEMDGICVIYTRQGHYSVTMEMQNPVRQYCADPDAYYEAGKFFEGLIRTLGEGYSLQKHDVLSRQAFKKDTKDMKFLSQSYMKHFEGREYTDVKTYLTITQEVKTGNFNVFNEKQWNDFWMKVRKVEESVKQQGIKYHLLNEKEMNELLHRFLAVNFRKGPFSFDNFKAMEGYVKVGDKAFKMIDLIDIDEVMTPATIKPMTREDSGYPVDLFSFLAKVPDVECVIYTQTFFNPNQRKETAKLTSNMNRKKNIKSPANELAAKDIEKLMNDIARDNKLLAYTNFALMVIVKGGEHELERPFNFIEKKFSDLGIGINKTAYNQMELYINTFPGNQFTMADYERFLCPLDAATCFMFKEYMKTDEVTPLKIHYADRQGIPVAMDITGKEGKMKLTTNSNFVSFGPSGSGKSFHMNSIVRQLYEQGTDIVMVDTGNSYEGLCSFVGGKYIAYTEEKPITMNPFRISREEYNIEKLNFLKSLIFLIWKGADARISKIEDTLITNVLTMYFDLYFNPFQGFSEEKRLEMKEQLMLEYKSMGKSMSESQQDNQYRLKIERKMKKLEAMAKFGSEEGERNNAENLLQMMEMTYGKKVSDISDEERSMIIYIEEEIDTREDCIRNIKVESLSFNTFYEFCLQYIPLECKWNQIGFDMAQFRYAINQFYKGGKFENTLNDDFDNSLFDESFIVFEVDAIKEDPLLFPIVTLIIMDVFLQKMRLKSCRKALIIEEAWKAIASPLMADYIKYLYKTVRKFWGIVGVVTQEVDDVISNPTLKETIINNSEVTILLDQEKFKERYEDIARMLGLSEIEQQKIWSINKLDNKDGRAFFKEVYVRRGSYGEVYGVEESPECYMAYTTERLEKDALKMYVQRYGNYEEGIRWFCADWKTIFPNSGKPDDFAGIINDSVKMYRKHYEDHDMDNKEIMKKYVEDWTDFSKQYPKPVKDNLHIFGNYLKKKKRVWES